MQFNSEANNLDLVSDIKYWCGIESTDTTSYPLTAMARNSNFALDIITGHIIKALGWEYDDSNNSATELLDVTTAIASGTRKYVIAATWLKIARVRVKDANGNWMVLERGDRRRWNTNQLSGASGTPREYDLLGNWIYLDASPNWSIAAGLEVQHQRGASYFASDSTTKTPGFATPFHRLVSMMASQDYTEVNDLEKRSVKLARRIGEAPTEASTGSGMLKQLVDFYSTRDVDNVVNIGTRKEDYGQAGLSDNGSSTGLGFSS